MNNFRKAYSSTALGALLIAFSIGGAFAQDANAVAQRLKETFATQDVVLNWSGVSGDASQIVLDGVTYSGPGMPPFTVGKVTLDNVAEANGGYTVGLITVPAINYSKDGISVIASPSTMKNARIPAATETDFLANSLLYDSGEIAKVEIKVGDKSVASLENTQFEMTPPTDGKLSFTADTEKLSADLSAIPDPKTQAVVSALGYQQITGNMQLAGSWNTTDGRMELSKYDIAVDNAGKLGITFDIGGYTPEFLKALQAIQKQMDANPGGGDTNAQNVAMLGLMQQLVFNGAALRFDDASLTNKALDFISKQQGSDPAQMREQTKAIVPFLLASSPIKDEALKKGIAEAVAKYIDDPKSLTISAKPATPQPFSSIAAQGQADPASLTGTLGLSITAND